MIFQTRWWRDLSTCEQSGYSRISKWYMETQKYDSGEEYRLQPLPSLIRYWQLTFGVDKSIWKTAEESEQSVWKRIFPCLNIVYGNPEIQFREEMASWILCRPRNNLISLRPTQHLCSVSYRAGSFSSNPNSKILECQSDSPNSDGLDLATL